MTALGVGDVRAQPVGREERHAHVVEAVVADQVPGRGHLASAIGVRLHPSALQEERGPHLEPGEGLEEARLGRGVGRSVGVLRVERQRDPERRPASAGLPRYLSIPVMTIPRMNTRWKMKNRITGMIRVMMLPAWISVVSEK